jgi:hypothetical protein
VRLKPARPSSASFYLLPGYLPTSYHLQRHKAPQTCSTATYTSLRFGRDMKPCATRCIICNRCNRCKGAPHITNKRVYRRTLTR